MSKETATRLAKIFNFGLFNKFSPAEIAELHEECSEFLKNALLTLVGASNIKELYDITELNFHLALIINNTSEAKLLLGRLSDKFGGYKNLQRVAILRSMYIEATEGPKAAAKFLESIGGFNKKTDIIRRRSYLTSKINPDAYINDLLLYLDVKPSDCEAWFELSEQYLILGNYSKAIYSLQQILIVTPFAYIVHYKLGTTYQSYAFKLLLDFSSSKKNKFDYNKETIESFYTYYNLSLKCFLKSVELSESFHKGWCGIYVLTKPLKLKNVNLLKKFEATADQYEKLNKLAKEKLSLIIKENLTNEENEKIIQEVMEKDLA